MDLITHILSLNLANCPDLATYHSECDALTYRAMRNTLYCMSQVIEDGREF